MTKLSTWCGKIDSHGCYDHEKTAARFKKETGKDAPWHGYRASVANATVGRFKGLEAPLNVPAKTLVADGVDIVESIWRKYCGENATVINALMGRGFRWSACIAALRKMGL